MKALDQKNHTKMYDGLKEEDRQVIEIDFGNTLDKLKGEYLDMYGRVKSEMLSIAYFDENSDLRTIYLGRIDMTRLDKIKVEEKVSYIRTWVYSRKAIIWHRMSDTFRNRSKLIHLCLSSHYLWCKSLHSLSRICYPKTQRIQVGNGQYMSVCYLSYQSVIDVHDHRFEIFTVVSEIHEKVDLVFGIENIFELEGIINS